VLSRLEPVVEARVVIPHGDQRGQQTPSGVVVVRRHELANPSQQQPHLGIHLQRRMHVLGVIEWAVHG
jgi:hypothetical protein